MRINVEIASLGDEKYSAKVEDDNGGCGQCDSGSLNDIINLVTLCVVERVGDE